jgi:hypothetical protein
MCVRFGLCPFACIPTLYQLSPFSNLCASFFTSCVINCVVFFVYGIVFVVPTLFLLLLCFALGASPMGVNGGVGVQTPNLLSDSMLHSTINSQK